MNEKWIMDEWKMNFVLNLPHWDKRHITFSRKETMEIKKRKVNSKFIDIA